MLAFTPDKFSIFETVICSVIESFQIVDDFDNGLLSPVSGGKSTDDGLSDSRANMEKELDALKEEESIMLTEECQLITITDAVPGTFYATNKTIAFTDGSRDESKSFKVTVVQQKHVIIICG